MGIRENDDGGGGSGSRSSGEKNSGVWGGFIVEVYCLVVSFVRGVVFHFAAFVF